MKYDKLKARIMEIYGTQEVFSKAMEMSRTSLNLRLNGVIDWKSSEIAKACELLHIDLSDAYLYFFTPKV